MIRLVSSVRVVRRGAHDVVRVWIRGGFAGELVTPEKDGAFVAVRLVGDPCTVDLGPEEDTYTPEPP